MTTGPQSASVQSAQQIVLVGLSGVGKSTVGAILAARLGWPLLDTDDLVRASEGQTAAQIITTRGEPAFREIEVRVVVDAAQHVPAVIATGGGAFQHPAARQALGRRGLICYLDATPAEIAQQCWDVLEQGIREAPECWLWSYKHWRFKPSGGKTERYPDYANTAKRFDDALLK